MLGKLLFTIDAVGLLLGAPLADYNHTHIFNPRWPPHAKFHCAQTINLSVTLGLATLYYTWRSSFLPKSVPPPIAREREQDSLRTALFTGTIYWIAGLASILYPGTAWVDPEFDPSGLPPQVPIFVGFGSAALLGWMLDRQG
ncbi:hypothetical protein C7999DRAFT_42760 [Corynascus novoguineensis]|uniref:Acetyltransferase n=1 Tax=Corynascus novoguineensis TaxID=1126955 RepID=A0AAN7CQV6_9PEZI|nr:hypothetical protein C7999DRAFT_42760 [Corynascus novoguineensis]